ncbi:MAG: ribonuclease P protein component [Luteibaculaceae bacterium]
MRFTLGRNKMLKQKLGFAMLVKSGKKALKHPVLAAYLWTEPTDKMPFKVAFSVSKKKFKRAVDRNKVKRHMREAFRISQALIEPKEGKQLLVNFIYLDTEIKSVQLLNSVFSEILARIVKQSSEKGTNFENNI